MNTFFGGKRVSEAGRKGPVEPLPIHGYAFRVSEKKEEATKSIRKITVEQILKEGVKPAKRRFRHRFGIVTKTTKLALCKSQADLTLLVQERGMSDSDGTAPIAKELNQQRILP